jgi:flagellar biogenesis protein FliO
MASTFDDQQDAGERLPAYQPTPPPREASISLSQAAQRTSDAVVASVEKVRAATQQPMQQLQDVSARVPRRALIGGGILLAVLLIWFVIRMIDSSSSEDAASENVLQVEDPTAIAPTDSIILTAIAQDTAWVSITMDGTRSQQVVVLPETDYRWSAMEKFVVSIQNAGAVQFFRNESPLPVFGKAGEAVREVKITRKDVTASNTAYKPPTQQAAPPKPAPKPAQAAPAKPKPAVAKKPAPTPKRGAAPQRGRRQVAKPQRKPQQPVRKPAATRRRQAIEQPIITPAPRQPIRR